MQTFRLIAMTACFLGIVITIFNSLYPSEKFSKQVKIIFSLIFILSIAKPVAAGKITLPEIGETVYASSDYYSSLNDSTYDYFIRSVENNISAALKAKLHEKNIYPEEIQTSINISDSTSISINEVIITIKDMTISPAVVQCITEATEGEAKVTVKEFKDEGNA